MTNDYKDYVEDTRFLDDYNSYQKRYYDTLAERDKKFIALVQKITRDRADMSTLLDIGCSTGNLLRHIKVYLPELELIGGDLAESSLEMARQDPNLDGIRFEKLDMLDLPENAYDIIVSSAVAQFLDGRQYELAMKSVFNALTPQGAYISFEWIHPHDGQEVSICEKSASHPDGLYIYARSEALVMDLVQSAGFSDVTFDAFTIGIDLERPERGDIPNSYTVRDEHGDRMCFRGAIYQPWCHLIASKP